MPTEILPQDEKHVQGRKPAAPKRKQQQGESPDRGQQGDGKAVADIERNFEDQAR
jgi:hypothetical protein